MTCISSSEFDRIFCNPIPTCWKQCEQSWTNMAEQVMSVLNLALQNVSTERERMELKFGEILKRNNTIPVLRKAESRQPALKDVYRQSMAPVKELLTGRIECTRIKEHYIKAYSATPEDDITNFFSIIQKKNDPHIQMDQLQDSVLSKSPAYVAFKEKHCLTTTYTFQIKKCVEEDSFF